LYLIAVIVALFAYTIWSTTSQWVKAGKPVSLIFEWSTTRNFLVIAFASLVLSITVYQLMIYSASVQVSMLSGVSTGFIILSLAVLRELTSQNLKIS